MGTSEGAFPGFRAPSYTMVPNELFDDLMADLSGAALKVLLYIVRRRKSAWPGRRPCERTPAMRWSTCNGHDT